MARHVPDHHVVIGISEGFGSSIPGPGRVHHHRMRLIRIGEMHGGPPDRVQRIERAWGDAGFTVKAFDDIELMVWEKDLCNVTLSAPTAAFDLTVGELMADPEAWAVALGCTTEAWQVGRAKGVPFRFDDRRDALRRPPPPRVPLRVVAVDRAGCRRARASGDLDGVLQPAGTVATKRAEGARQP